MTVSESAVRVSILADHGATVVRIVYMGFVGGRLSSISATGSAKREPGDVPDPETGRLLATARALEALAARLRKKANGRIRNAAALKGHREEITRRAADGYPQAPRPGEVTFNFRTVGPVGLAVAWPMTAEQRPADELLTEPDQEDSERI